MSETSSQSTTAIPATGVSSSTPPQPASYADLKAALAGADAAFLCSQLEASAPIAAAQTAWMVEQNRRIEATQKEAAEAKAAVNVKKPGVDTLGNGSQKKTPTEGDPMVAWNEALAEKIRAGHPRAKALSMLVREQPELHEEYIAAYNEQVRRARGKN